MIGSAVRNAARSVTAPIRNFINRHFEMMKVEVRESASISTSASAEVQQRLSGLENTLAEQALHQSRTIARLGDEIEEMSGRIEELERIVNRLADVVGASNTVQL